MHTGVHKISLSVIVEERQRTNPVDVPRGKFVRARRSIALQSGISSVLAPVEFRVFAFERGEQQILMVAAKANDLIGRPSLEIDQKLDNATAIGPSIDIVTKEDELRPSCACVLLAKADKFPELVRAPMNVSNRIGLTQSVAPGKRWGWLGQPSGEPLTFATIQRAKILALGWDAGRAAG